jgi:hypothetical protein
MFVVQFSLGYITVQGGLLYWLVSLIQIGPMTLMIRKSTAGYVFSLGSGPVTWACKKKQAISLSSAEAEYQASGKCKSGSLVALTDPFRVWIPAATSDQPLVCNNQSAIKLTKDPVQHQHRKHIDIHMHFIRKLIHDQVIEVLFFPTKDQVADIFTKSLTEVKFSKLRSMLGVQEVVIKGG